MAQPTAQDQLMLELVNQARANPQAEANRLLGGNLNKGLSSGTISNAAKQPLAFNLQLFNAARDHSQWMLNTDQFSHTGVGGSQPWDRAGAAGYPWSRVGENIAWRGTTGTLNFNTAVQANQDGLFQSAGHRTNILNDSYREIGISNLSGDFGGYNAAMTTQLFGSNRNNQAFLTGVVYSDAVTDDNFYSIGEGLGSVTVKATGNGQTFSTQTLTAGGYQMSLAPGNYSVVFEGDFNGDGKLDQTQAKTVTVGAKNVKVDFATDTWTNSGTPNPAPTNPAPINPALTNPAPTNPAPTSKTLTGTSQADRLIGSARAETLKGFAGADRLYGKGEKDTLLGGAHNDLLVGGTHSDVLMGGDGHDRLVGVDPGSRNPGAGELDTLFGNAGRDTFVLGNSRQAFYVERQTIEGRALIKDFNRRLDRIRLHGSAGDYRLVQQKQQTQILYGASGTPNELIGVIQGDFAGLSLTGNYFSYA
jgi:serralysin